MVMVGRAPGDGGPRSWCWWVAQQVISQTMHKAPPFFFLRLLFLLFPPLPLPPSPPIRLLARANRPSGNQDGAMCKPARDCTKPCCLAAPRTVHIQPRMTPSTMQMGRRSLECEISGRCWSDGVSRVFQNARACFWRESAKVFF